MDLKEKKTPNQINNNTLTLYICILMKEWLVGQEFSCGFWPFWRCSHCIFCHDHKLNQKKWNFMKMTMTQVHISWTVYSDRLCVSLFQGKFCWYMFCTYSSYHLEGWSILNNRIRIQNIPDKLEKKNLTKQ